VPISQLKIYLFPPSFSISSLREGKGIGGDRISGVEVWGEKLEGYV